MVLCQPSSTSSFNWRRIVRVGERAALPNFGRCTSCVGGCVAAAAAKAAFYELRPGLSSFKGAAAAANSRPCQISRSCDLSRSQILPCVAAAFDVANCRTQFVQSEPTKIMSKILVPKKIFPNA